ncbi:hypothetical protein ACFE04_014988 [Oxalis oulophora]
MSVSVRRRWADRGCGGADGQSLEGEGAGGQSSEGEGADGQSLEGEDEGRRRMVPDDDMCREVGRPACGVGWDVVVGVWGRVAGSGSQRDLSCCVVCIFV